jgi:hypothetical protein
MKLALALLFSVFLIGCDDAPTQQPQSNTSQTQPQTYTIGGRIQYVNIYHPDSYNPQWFTHIGFVHDDGVMQELNLCDGQGMLRADMRVAFELSGVPGSNGCYTIVKMRRLD